jgi:hypothetical protein
MGASMSCSTLGQVLHPRWTLKPATWFPTSPSLQRTCPVIGLSLTHRTVLNPIVKPSSPFRCLSS